MNHVRGCEISKHLVQAQKVKPFQFVIFLEVRNLFSEPRKGVTLAIVHTAEGKKKLELEWMGRIRRNATAT